MQISKILKNQVTGRIELYDIENVLLASLPANAGIAGDKQSRIIAIASVETNNVVSFGYRTGKISLSHTAAPPAVFSGSFTAFMQQLTTNYFNLNVGSGGGAGDASAANQVVANNLLDTIKTSTEAVQSNTGFTRFYTDRIDQNTQQLIGINDAQRVAIGDKTDAAVINPAQDASVIAVLKGIASNTAPAPTPSTHFRNSATTNSVLVKSGSGKILSGTFTNRTTGTKYLRIYSFNSTPTPTLTPVLEIAALTGATVQIPPINGFILGIAYIISSSANQAGAQLTTADAASVQLSYI